MATVASGEDVKQVHREPHPFVSKDHIKYFVGKTISFVGKIDKVEESCLYMKTADGKYLYSYFQANSFSVLLLQMQNHNIA